MRHVNASGDTPRVDRDDSLRIEIKPHPFSFSADAESSLECAIVEAVNHMGGVGEAAERSYQDWLNRVCRHSVEAVRLIAHELKVLPADQYLDRWSLVQLLAELRQPASLEVLDDILSTTIPEERSMSPHSFTTRGEEVMIRTTAVEALTRIASDGLEPARDLLLLHVRHENLSVRRACVQGYLAVTGDEGRARVAEALRREDGWLLDVKRIDVREAPQAEGGRHLKPCDNDVFPQLLPESDKRPGEECGC